MIDNSCILYVITHTINDVQTTLECMEPILHDVARTYKQINLLNNSMYVRRLGSSQNGNVLIGNCESNCGKLLAVVRIIHTQIDWIWTEWAIDQRHPGGRTKTNHSASHWKYIRNLSVIFLTCLLLTLLSEHCNWISNQSFHKMVHDFPMLFAGAFCNHFQWHIWSWCRIFRT